MRGWRRLTRSRIEGLGDMAPASNWWELSRGGGLAVAEPREAAVPNRGAATTHPAVALKRRSLAGSCYAPSRRHAAPVRPQS